MSTHNICFHGEIKKKMFIFFQLKKKNSRYGDNINKVHFRAEQKQEAAQVDGTASEIPAPHPHPKKNIIYKIF